MELSNWTIFSLIDRDFASQIRLACVFGEQFSSYLHLTDLQYQEMYMNFKSRVFRYLLENILHQPGVSL